MCYILAKDVNKHGCVAFKATHGKDLAELKANLDHLTKDKKIQIVIISRPTAYGEYAPYSFVSTKEELIDYVSKM